MEDPVLEHILYIMIFVLIIATPHITWNIIKHRKNRKWREEIKKGDLCFFYEYPNSKVQCKVSHIYPADRISVEIGPNRYHLIELEGLYII